MRGLVSDKRSNISCDSKGIYDLYSYLSNTISPLIKVHVFSHDKEGKRKIQHIESLEHNNVLKLVVMSMRT